MRILLFIRAVLISINTRNLISALLVILDLKGAIMIRLLTFKSIVGVFVTVIIIVLFVFINQGKNIPVLNYHQVEDNVNNPLTLSKQEFAEQMAYLRRHGYNSITPDQLVKHIKNGVPLPDNPILITLDDGYRDNYTNAYPIMKKYGFTGTIFLITDVVGHNDWYLNWDQIREMQQGGFIFGSHTLNHVPLTTLTRDEARRQLVESKEAIEWRLHTPVTCFAYPTGAYNQEIEGLLRDSGYEAAFSVHFGRVGMKSEPYALERIPVFKSRYSFYDFYFRLNFTIVAEQLKSAIRPLWHMVHD
jgi:peptidoglycan/xylan/chitin deacetylase (PgdA/CDA1 family)